MTVTKAPPLTKIPGYMHRQHAQIQSVGIQAQWQLLCLFSTSHRQLMTYGDRTMAKSLISDRLVTQRPTDRKKFLCFIIEPAYSNVRYRSLNFCLSVCPSFPRSECQLLLQLISQYLLGPNKHGLITYIQVNVYIGNTLSWLNGGWAFKTNVCWRLNNHISVVSLHIFLIFFKKQWFNILSLRLYCYIYWKFICLYEHQQET